MENMKSKEKEKGRNEDIRAKTSFWSWFSHFGSIENTIGTLFCNILFYHGSSIRVGEQILTYLKTPRICAYLKRVSECRHSSVHWIPIIPSVLRIWIGCCCRLDTRIVLCSTDK